ncbi:hypothetical protein OEIGOIKO_03361 [Streptomyces chrestomyceticus JCM 4735]|uniref:Uncharacterized protein n=1 Tax=Streptomyces chrestomyceticus JCM 4735 TaxID=1306181 RepID=A0A7U9PYE2_9ACTN|nr:hypothetical protein [Streptomyces chrestomyceticus]GCD35615.1 hypothetical protein OEIGOIKO_03361 [Streptomyces chrestomyceticus JCM 4735]
MHVRFDTPPIPHRSQETHETAQALRGRPGDWAHIDTHDTMNRASNQAHRVRTGKLAAFRPAGAFEAKAHGTEDGGAEVWARYVGPRTSGHSRQLPHAPV